MATVTTSEIVRRAELKAPFSMIEGQALWTRLIEQLSQAVAECRRDPRAFLHELFYDDNKDLQRSKRVRLGFVIGFLTNVLLISVIAVVGMYQIPVGKDRAQEGQPEYKVTMLPEMKESNPDKTPEAAKPSDLPKGTKEGNGATGTGSGGGGQNDPRPPSVGQLPQSAPIAPIINPIAQNMPNPSLPVNPLTTGELTPPPPPDARIGIPNGAIVEPSAGPGKGGGMGGTNGTGVGTGSGPGGGDNGNGNRGGRIGNPGVPNGSPATSAIDYAQLKQMPDSTGIVWIRRVRAIISPEAQANKDYGYVLIEATFNADGTITDIRVRQSVPSMDDAAIESVKQAKFRPATIRGVPITLRRVPIKVNIVLGEKIGRNDQKNLLDFRLLLDLLSHHS